MTDLNVSQVKLRVHIYQHTVLHSQLQLMWQLAIAVENGSATAQTR